MFDLNISLHVPLACVLINNALHYEFSIAIRFRNVPYKGKKAFKNGKSIKLCHIMYSYLEICCDHKMRRTRNKFGIYEIRAFSNGN